MAEERDVKRAPSSNSLWTTTALLLLLAACGNVRYHSFQSIDGAWNATDTLTYTYINNSDAADSIDLEVGLRCTSSYPSRELWLSIEYISKGRHTLDTLQCEIFDSLGRQNGSCAGLLYQTTHAAGTRTILPHDTTLIKILHLMDKEVEGVTDVGVKISIDRN